MLQCNKMVLLIMENFIISTIVLNKLAGSPNILPPTTNTAVDIHCILSYNTVFNVILYFPLAAQPYRSI